jgi:hypothetical protein
MTQDESRDMQDWRTALQLALTDAIEHLQVLIFEDGWDALRAEAGSDEAALRESAARYERELGRLFSFLRLSGALPDAVGWSELKTDYRRAALEAGTEISLRTALESGFYVAEPAPLGDHGVYLRWAAALRRFLIARAPTGADWPMLDAADDERLQWAYETLAELEEHDAFQAAFVDWLRDESAGRLDVDEIVEAQERMLRLPRFDLVLNASLRWLALRAMRGITGDPA